MRLSVPVSAADGPGEATEAQGPGRRQAEEPLQMGSLRREKFQRVQLDRRLWGYPYSLLAVLMIITSIIRIQHPCISSALDLQPALFPLLPSTYSLKPPNFICYGALSAPKHKLTS